MTAYFLWKQKASLNQIWTIVAVFLASLLYINFLPSDDFSDTLILACIHLPLILWGALGFAFVNGQLKNHNKGLSFLRFNGDLIVMTTLICSGCVMTTLICSGFVMTSLISNGFVMEEMEGGE